MIDRRSVLFLMLAAACVHKTKVVVYEPTPDQPGGAGESSTETPSSGETTETTTEPTKPAVPTTGDPDRRELPLATVANRLVVEAGTLLWADVSGELWSMPADWSKPPSKLSNQHKDGFVQHPFLAGGHVLAKVSKELVEVAMPAGPLARVKVQGLPDLPEEVVGDASHVFFTVFRHQDVLSVPVAGGTPQKLLSMNGAVLALHGDTLYVASQYTGELVALPVAGGPKKTLAKGLGRPIAMAADDDAVYVYAEKDQKVLRIERATGAVSTIGEQLNHSDQLVPAGDAIYTVSWPGRLVKLSKHAGAPVTTLVDGMEDPKGVAVDDKFVYVTTKAPPRLVRVPRH